MTMLFYGIQAAGPRLTPANLDKGLHAIPETSSTDPYRPAAYFADGNYSFVKDQMSSWWDINSSPPGSGVPGCFRLAEDGRRYRAGDWTPGDAGLLGSGVCQGPRSP